MEWTVTVDELPPEGEKVEAMDNGGHVQELVRQRNLWFFPDMSMYVYYTPVKWRIPEPKE